MGKFNNLRKFTYVVILYLFCSISGFATHIKAGEFSAKRLSASSLEYEITLTLYYNTSGTSVDPDQVNIDFGDGTSQTVTRQPKTNIGNNTSKNVFVVNHTYNGASTFLVSMRDQNRNANIQNIPGSSNVAFYVEMQLKINPLFGVDNSPVMTVPPIDFGAVNRIFTHNPGAYDPDGDSLSYELIPAQSDFNQIIVGYNYPASPVFGGTSTLGGPAFITLDPVRGDLVWNTPSDYGTPPRFYNIAMKITEWRYGKAIGYIVRDMQVEIFESINHPPKLAIPKDLCIGAGQIVNGTFSATDPDNDDVLLETYGLPYDVPSSPAVAVISPVGVNPTGTFTWQTNCSHVRKQPYQVVFKASDQNAVPILTDIESWLIYVKGPKITNITATPNTNSITLNWPLYTCSNEASQINIYRRDCDSIPPSTDSCKTGPLAGYTLIGTVPSTAITFTDNNKGAGIDKGKSYCYILVAEYPAPGYGESYSSDQVCAALNLDVPVFSSIDVTQTSTTNGKVSLTWYQPTASVVPGPYTYSLERGTGASATSFTPIATITDTFYVDSGLDTKDLNYSYRIKLVNNGLYSSTISTFNLTTVANDNKATLKWNYGTTWLTDSIEVYRKVNSGTFVKLTTLGNTSLSYTDNAIVNCDTVYYFVKQFGSYCDKHLATVATQTSAIDSVRPMSTIPPPAPTLTVQGCNGDLMVFQDVLNWNDLSDPNCNNIDHYNVYFALHTSDGLTLLTQTKNLSYTYINQHTTAGCFAVSATNLAGVEGAQSTKVCVDDCVDYRLPNLLTINGDLLNDLMRPFNIPQGAPRGAEFVRFSVYNCWGALVYYKDTDPNIMWDGSVNGAPISDGIYYFNAEVHFYGRVNKADEVKNIKGWVQLLTAK